MRWSEFAKECPELADIGRRWMAESHIVLLGTLRADGSPRISAVECDLIGDDLYSGMIWQSAKALDLIRDPRMTLHSLPPGKDNPDGDLKLYGRAVDVPEPDRRRRYGDTLYARIEWRPDEPYHLFSYEIGAAGFLRFHHGGRDVWSWHADRGLRKRFRQD